jgi:hypothetical protein
LYIFSFAPHKARYFCYDPRTPQVLLGSKIFFYRNYSLCDRPALPASRDGLFPRIRPLFQRLPKLASLKQGQA